MIRNYFKTAWRNIARNTTFSTINILGLAMGLTCSLLIILWVQDERSVDAFHANGKQLYQVYERNYYDGKIDAVYNTQGLLAGELKRAIPEVQYATSLEQKAPFPFVFAAGDKIIKFDGSFAGADFFKMFTYPLLQGNTETALTTPNGIAVSRKMAEAFFGSPEKAIGKSILYENKENLLITAVFENPPANSSQQFDFLRNWRDYAKQNAWLSSWGSASPYTFVQLRKDADATKVEAKIKDFISRYTAQTKETHTELALQPYTEKYLHSTFKNGQVAGGRIEYVRLFTLVAVFILLIACINFMNLATARSTKRAKEVGIRKVAGASRAVLIRQFIGEALLLTFFSILIAVAAAGILLPTFNNLTEKSLSLPVTQPVFWASLIALLTVTGFVAGSYPALFLSSLNPNKVLKGSLKFSAGATLFRKGLVVFQFALSIILIVGMIVIFRQINYTQTKNLGYDRENLLYIPLEGDLVKNYALFKEEAGKFGGIVSISKMKESPTVIGHRITDVGWAGKDPGLNTSFADATVGYDFVKTMHLKMKEGHDFSRDFGTDSTGYIVNETAVKKIGYQNPIGQPLSWGDQHGKIIGVLKDFHFNSLHEAIEPLIIRFSENQKWGTILVRTRAGKTKQALAELEKVCKKMNPQYPFTYQFSDQEYARLYNNEELVSKLSNYFAFLAIFISCLGLFGLATFTAEQRTKEIGVRKVLGASVPNIVSLLSTSFLKPVAVAMLIGFPVSRYLMNEWLQGFAYKIDISWWVFAFAGLLVISISLLTVSYQVVKAAFGNPMKSLRTE
jgi:ABC-type antimicrobial peptide transport system permease subunit